MLLFGRSLEGRRALLSARKQLARYIQAAINLQQQLKTGYGQQQPEVQLKIVNVVYITLA